MVLVLVVFGTLVSAIQITAYPNGAPKKVCIGSMLPHHHHLPPQPITTSPITKFDATWNSDNRTVSSKAIYLFTYHLSFF